MRGGVVVSVARLCFSCIDHNTEGKRMRDENEHVKLNEAKWNRWASSLDGKGWRYEFLRKAQLGVISFLGICEDIHFLDIGCGTGWAVGQASERFAGKGVFYGVDLSDKMIAKAKENFDGRGNMRFVTADAELVPLESNFFDIIICTNSFHHYLHPDKALQEMHRLLRDGGQVYILDPTADNWITKLADKVMRLIEPQHVKMYGTQEFQSLFETAGLIYLRSNEVAPYQIVHIAKKQTEINGPILS